MKLSDIAHQQQLRHQGKDPEITGIAPLTSAGPKDLSFVTEKKFFASPTEAAALLLPESLTEMTDKPCLISATPAFHIARIAPIFGHKPFQPPSGSDSEKNRFIAPSAVLENDVQIGPGAVIGAHVRIGEGTIIHAGAVIHERCRIGRQCIIHSNVVIGADGFGFEWDSDTGTHLKIAHFGTVRIEDRVEIGAGTTIDRARFEETVIGSGTKIDNLVQIAHNVYIGRNVLIIAQTGIAGSCRIEDNAIIGPKVGIVPHTTIGKNARIVGSTNITKDVPPNATWSGWWGKDHRKNLLEMQATQSLPEIIKPLRRLAERFFNNVK